MADESGKPDRRNARRYSCTGKAEIVVPGRGLRYAGELRNLSASGCFIETNCRLERGTSVELWVKAEGLSLRVAAHLLARRMNGVALRFHPGSGRRLEQIRQLIAELEAMDEGAEPQQTEAQPAQQEAGAVVRAGGRMAAAQGDMRGWRRTLYSLCVRWRENSFRRKAAFRRSAADGGSHAGGRRGAAWRGSDRGAAAGGGENG